jgi:hypothetical protein
MELSPSWKAANRSNIQDIPIGLESSQKLSAGPCSKQSNLVSPLHTTTCYLF